MKVAIMQPYFFPYLGYFQLISAVEKFVFYDDVNFIKNGWVNRNRIIQGGKVNYVTLPLSAASSFKKINEIRVQSGEGWRKKTLESIRHAYSKAPYFDEIGDIVSEVINSNDLLVSEVAKLSVEKVSKYLGLTAEFIRSSSVYSNASLGGAERVLDICRQAGASEYINLPGGRDLYDPELFSSRGIDLHFINPVLRPYKQTTKEFHPGLSIIDVLMFNHKDAVLEMLAFEGDVEY
ncbi:WbqC family protein [Paraburkholderia silvatlantica]|uniref:WbqC family protein n=1 Tax=Paraburkholderia silvatlantica TaxID=321895 RepID=UPI0037512F38